MDTSQHNLSTLFQQLGLSASNEEIDKFLTVHSLKPDAQLSEADFWNESQAEFLRVAVEEDADWAEVVDELDARLRH
ncbi:DUF2789 domain-containing protein [Endozoicomonas sp. SM1973]|uniref:DUF2789 domain-containing protein n=1 Tax=Spartinivicinus marinus TaxID=2994442 RepID=A0A853I3K6_9GAMM|nr:DUF2789 domain-containing protein [Spartinivicinus marinus]MCX4027716.1 DUF2789 domain-containing protein [Spartinivicinus marinus]NYZ68520.1 DUF2789 domain-containing protein [Spartinivicinus marinus]